MSFYLLIPEDTMVRVDFDEPPPLNVSNAYIIMKGFVVLHFNRLQSHNLWIL